MYLLGGHVRMDAYRGQMNPIFLELELKAVVSHPL